MQVTSAFFVFPTLFLGLSACVHTAAEGGRHSVPISALNPAVDPVTKARQGAAIPTINTRGGPPPAPVYAAPVYQASGSPAAGSPSPGPQTPVYGAPGKPAIPPAAPAATRTGQSCNRTLTGGSGYACTAN